MHEWKKVIKKFAYDVLYSVFYYDDKLFIAIKKQL